MKPHKHAKVIKAWANGAKIQWWNEEHRKWFDLDDSRPFSWDESIVYSIKPEEKKPVVRWLWAIDKGNGFELHPLFVEDEKIPFSAMRYGAIRLDWSRTEFPE